MADPYLLPNGTLQNKLGLDDAAELAFREARIVGAREMMLHERSVDGEFDFATLRAIHRFLFQDVYGWAGEPRTCHLAKREYENDANPPVAFVAPDRIAREAIRIFAGLARKKNLKGLPRARFAAEAARVFVALNNLHPFREGNGRTQRAFLRRLAAEAGHRLDFDAVTHERMVAVSVAGAKGDVEPAARLFTELLDPDRVRALRKALGALKKSDGVPWNDLYVATTIAGRAYVGSLVGAAPPDFMMRVGAAPVDWIAIGTADDLPDDAKPRDELAFKATRWR